MNIVTKPSNDDEYDSDDCLQPGENSNPPKQPDIPSVISQPPVLNPDVSIHPLVDVGSVVDSPNPPADDDSDCLSLTSPISDSDTNVIPSATCSNSSQTLPSSDTLRRSGRTKQTPSHLDDYVVY